ncbi:MAG: CapA family protein [Firmicutes bacterium]|nr:CapA family protein [Bacillota bacterium]
MKNPFEKLLSVVLGFFARAAVTLNDIFNKGNPSENPAGKGTENGARPRRRLVDGINTDRFTQLCAVLVIGFVSIIGAILISVSLSSGSREVDVDTRQEGNETGAGSVTLTFGGNIMPSQDMIDSAVTENGYNFSNYMAELAQVMTGDISIAGLCGQVDINGGDAEVCGLGKGNNYPSQLASAVSGAGVDYIFGANNYAFLNGFDGMLATVSAIKSSSLGVIGLTDVEPDKLNSGVVRINGINIGLAGYDCVSAKSYDKLTDEQKQYMVKLGSDPDGAAERISQDIKKMKNRGADFIVVCVNWGQPADKVESDFMKKAAKKIAEAGADVIVGYGAYVTLGSEVIELERDGTENECYVFYSLGCLFADMTERKDYTDAMSRSMVVTIEAARGKDGSVKVNSAVYDPIYMIKNSPEEDSQAYLKYMAVPAANYVSAEKCPDIFTDAGEWNRCKSAFRAICAIADKSGGRLVLNESGRYAADNDEPCGKI